MLIINQVVKGGDDFAGSNQVSHIVDATLMLDADDESPLKMLRALKNRFGDTSEVGLFRHEDKGLVEIPIRQYYMRMRESDKTTGTALRLSQRKPPDTSRNQCLGYHVWFT